MTGLTVVWGLRLAVHIARRGSGHGEDPRYEAMLARARGNRNLYALRMVYLLQGALVWLVSLPVQAAQYPPRPLSALAWAGTAVWAVGLFFEAVGDAQLTRFKADPANRGRIMDQGLWRLTRHPNYFGDFCVWWGLFLVACDGGRQAAAVSVVSPVVMSVLLINGSGKRLLERHMAGRPGWDAYMARTSAFFPGHRADTRERVGEPVDGRSPHAYGSRRYAEQGDRCRGGLLGPTGRLHRDADAGGAVDPTLHEHGLAAAVRVHQAGGAHLPAVGEPQLVHLAAWRCRHLRHDEHRPVPVGGDHECARTARHLRRTRPGVGRGQHSRHVLGVPLRSRRPVLSVLRAFVLPCGGGAEGGSSGHAGGERPPCRALSAPHATAYPLQGRDTWRGLPHGGDALQYPLPHDGACAHRGGQGQASGGGRELGDLLRTGVALGQVTFEGGALVAVQRVHRVGTCQSMRIGRGHAVTPKQSRSRMSPSRSRVLTVPSGSASASATSR